MFWINVHVAQMIWEILIIKKNKQKNSLCFSLRVLCFSDAAQRPAVRHGSLIDERSSLLWLLCQPARLCPRVIAQPNSCRVLKIYILFMPSPHHNHLRRQSDGWMSACKWAQLASKALSTDSCSDRDDATVASAQRKLCSYDTCASPARGDDDLSSLPVTLWRSWLFCCGKIFYLVKLWCKKKWENSSARPLAWIWASLAEARRWEAR